MPEPTTYDDILASLVARCPEHGTSTETWPECRCAAARKTAALMAQAPAQSDPAPGAPEPHPDPHRGGQPHETPPAPPRRPS